MLRVTVGYTVASLYKRGAFWYLKPASGIARSLKLRHAVAAETQRAHDLLEAEKAKERRVYAEPERWECWVPQFIRQRYEESPKSLARYELRWRSIRAFLTDKAIEYPRQLTFAVASQYVEWRRAGSMAFGVWPGHKNTAIGDVKFLGLLMRRAVALGFAGNNPCSALGVKKQKPEPKPEIPDAHLEIIWMELQAVPEWMRVQWQICLYTGCRLREAALPLSCVDVRRGFIHFPTTKGDRPFTVPMRSELRPLFKRLIDQGRSDAFDMPPMPSKHWWQFFRGLSQRHKIPRYCVHCARVTFVSRCARAGVPISEAMRLVNHASETIHRVYQRFQPQDLRSALRRMKFPATHDAP